MRQRQGRTGQRTPEYIRAWGHWGLVPTKVWQIHYPYSNQVRGMGDRSRPPHKPIPTKLWPINQPYSNQGDGADYVYPACPPPIFLAFRCPWGRGKCVSVTSHEWYRARTTDAQRGNSLHCTAENSLPLPNF